MTDGTETRTGWLSPEGLESVRGEMPIVYVDAIPVRLDQRGVVTHVGLLLRVAADGTISRTVISGRVWEPDSVGRIVYRWYVGGERVASWSVNFAVEPE